MLCQNCQKRPANVHFTQIINNDKVEMYLCEQCANEKGHLDFGSPLNINDFISGLIGINENGGYRNTKPKEDLVCDKCGMSFQEFQQTGKLGCGNCYEIYREKLRPLLKRLHGSAAHHGKVPGMDAKAVKATREVEKLKKLLNEAIKNEEYEKAAEIRDKIKVIER